MIPTFAIQLICGLSTAWAVSPRKQITSGFFRIQMLITLGLSVLFLLTRNQLPGISELPAAIQWGSWITGIALAVLSFLGSVAWTLERRAGGSLFAIAIAAVSSIAVLAVGLNATSGGFWGCVDLMSAAWLIGAVTAAMLLGHWYLTATGMSLAPFTQYNKLLILAVSLRMSVVIGRTIVTNAGAAENMGLAVLRWSGLIGPLVMAILAVQILRYRNTQSATGILYAATTLVFMGEMAAHLQ